MNDHGQYNSPHTHPLSVISGVYYVNDGGDPLSSLHFISPTGQGHPSGNLFTRYVFSSASNLSEGAFGTSHRGPRVVPQGKDTVTQIATPSGSLVLFPSWLSHYTVPHPGADSRIVIAFNLRVTQEGKSEDGPLQILIPGKHAARLTAGKP